MIRAYLLVANVAMLAHFGFLAFLIGGGFWAWSRPWLVVPHLVTAGWGFGIGTWHWTCPLTELEQETPAPVRSGFTSTTPSGAMPAPMTAALVGAARRRAARTRAHHDQRRPRFVIG